MKRIITRIKGGLGNQLFCYAAARRLAIINDAELVIDNISGFTRDHIYKRQYMLSHFNIPARFTTSNERLMPFEHYRRGLFKWISSRKRFESRQYVEQENNDFDKRLLSIKVNGTIYLDGYWQSEQYFTDIESTIRQDLEIIPPKDKTNLDVAELINNTNAVCIHVRWFDTPNNENIGNNIDIEYYKQAISIINKLLDNKHFFIFSDYPNETKNLLKIDENICTYINHNKGDENAYADLWLMSLCKNFIIANSTFSWWGAWLSQNPTKIVIAPTKIKNGEGSWGFKGLFPESWILI